VALPALAPDAADARTTAPTAPIIDPSVGFIFITKRPAEVFRVIAWRECSSIE